MALPPPSRRQHLLGLLLGAEGLLTQEAVNAVLDEQASRRADGQFHHFGKVALELALVTHVELDWALALQDRLAFAAQERDRLGYMLLEAGLVKPTHIADALETQALDGGLLGELLVERGHLDAAKLAAMLDAQGVRG